MWARILSYLSAPWDSIWIDSPIGYPSASNGASVFSRNCFALLWKGMFFSGVLIPLRRSLWPVSISRVSPSIILVTWKVCL